MANDKLPDPPSNFSVENSLSSELLKLSFHDRAAIEEEIHGVRCGAAKETPELLERSLSDFDLELNERKEKYPSNDLLRNVIRISSLDETALQSAKTKCYLNDPEIRLRFLRCEIFDVEKAVQRLINYLEFTSELFGDFVADRSICISDFKSKEEETALQNSRNQYLPFRDRSGRRVLAGVGNCNFHLEMNLRFKIMMYLHWVVSEDLETQRKGVVIIAWIFDEEHDNTWEKKFRPGMNFEYIKFHRKCNSALPIRLASLQQYYLKDTLFFRSLSSLYVFHLQPNQRIVYKSFFGDQTELLYKLSSFGVPADMLPVSCTGTVKTANHASWINVQRAKLVNGQNSTSEEIVECPNSEDVVFKKGPGYKCNPGNLYFRFLIESAAEKHQNADKEEKYQITMRIVEQIEGINGRFLEWSKTRKMWIINKNRNMIRTKIASSIKQYNRKRGQSLELKDTISNAADVLPSNGDANNDAHGGNDKNQGGRLKQYYSIDHSYHPKRRKILSLCDLNNPGDSIDDDNFCFGRTFFPTK